MGDSECLMTRHVASDLLRRLVVSETQTVSSIPVITSTGKDVMNYPFFKRCIQQTAELLVTLDPRFEETLKEKLDAGEHIGDLISPDQILSLVDTAVKTSVETSKPEIVYQCRLITEGLRLAEVCTADEDLRNGLLEVTTAALCAHISETQLITNPVVVFMEKPPSQRTEKTAEWGVHGVAVVLELLRLLASLKDFSKLHKDQYWRSLKDPRLISFLAFALAYGDHEMVHNALVIYTHCSQLQAFPSRWSRSCEPMDTAAAVPAVVVSPRRSSKENERVLDEVLQRIRDGFSVKDAKISDVLSAYEKKILLMERRERELELLLSAKDQALAQSEKLRIQFRGAGSNNNDMARVRSLVSDCEALREKNEAVTKELEATRQLLQEKTAT
ncbi:hypothetical protein COOONC_07565, partial [Cooperia oncophora]